MLTSAMAGRVGTLSPLRNETGDNEPIGVPRRCRRLVVSSPPMLMAGGAGSRAATFGVEDGLTHAPRENGKHKQLLSRPLGLCIRQIDATILVGPQAIRPGPFAAIGKLI